jgi:hypothetical protein
LNQGKRKMLPFLIRGVAHHLWNFADFALAALKCLADRLLGTSIMEHPGHSITLGLRIPRHPAQSEIGMTLSEGSNGIREG